MIKEKKTSYRNKKKLLENKINKKKTKENNKTK